MKTTTISQLDDADYAKIEIMHSLGIPRSEADMIMYLISAGPSGEKDITAGTGLPQPQVSMSSRKLQARGWLTREAVKTLKGRPGYQYSMIVTLPQIADQLRAENDERQAEFMRLLGELVKESTTTP